MVVAVAGLLGAVVGTTSASAAKPRNGAYAARYVTKPTALVLRVRGHKVKWTALHESGCVDPTIHPKLTMKIKRNGKFSGSKTVTNPTGTYQEKISGRFTSSTEAAVSTSTVFTASDPSAFLGHCESNPTWSLVHK